MKFTLLTTLSVAAAALAASVTPAHFNTIDAATYKAIANGTLSPANLPPVGRRTDLQARDAGNVYLCTAANWQQYCVYITDAGPGECVNLAADLNDQVSSFGPDPNQQCYVFAGFDCDPLSGRIGPISAPGVADLSKSFNTGEEGGGRPFNDVISSYLCNYTP
ncbi:hypothetical protein DFH08DRAFT_821448 [Mycena albidolilacea]|uniref:Uncharacterized protein n=1 Tax=Mycena albidolilacea TaxID=1033008 RepID=A0AAD6ZA99_9AGAR|nr:hypothetical protein DFH08DRAFT_821448 [Mycena albidolilacea]